MKIMLSTLTIKELEILMTENKFKPYRAKQIFKWVYEKGIHDPNLMTDLPARLKVFLYTNISFLNNMKD